MTDPSSCEPLIDITFTPRNPPVMRGFESYGRQPTQGDKYGYKRCALDKPLVSRGKCRADSVGSGCFTRFYSEAFPEFEPAPEDRLGNEWRRGDWVYTNRRVE